MKAKRLMALVLAALMAGSTANVAFAVELGEVNEDQVLNFYPTPIGDDLYMKDEDGYIRAAAPGDFAPGDDIYISLKEYAGNFSSRDVGRLDLYEDWEIGDSWVEDVEIVRKKGQWKESQAPAKTYDIFGTGIKAFDQDVTFTTSKTESATLLALAKQALEEKVAAAEAEVFDGYDTEVADEAYQYNGSQYTSKEGAAEVAITDGVYENKSYHTVDGTPAFGALPSSTTSGYLNGKKLYLNEMEALVGAQWHLYDAAADGTRYATAQYAEGYGELGETNNGDPAVLTLAEYLSNNGVSTGNVYVDSNRSKFIILNHEGMTKDVLAKQIGFSTVNGTVYYETAGSTHTTLEVKTDLSGYFKNGTEFVGQNLRDVSADMEKSGLMKTIPGDTVYIVNGQEKTKDEAKAAAAATVQQVLAAMTRKDNIDEGTVVSTFAHNPTGSYDGYISDSGYHYWLQISTKSSSTTREVDIYGEIGIGTTRNEAKDNTISIDVTMTNADAGMDDEYEDFVHIDPDTRAVVDFANDASDEFEVEFGDDAYFIFNARGQGKLNLAYNTKFNKDIAYDYDHANIDFINFEAEPTTNRTGTLYIYADEDSYIYEVTSKGVKKINGAYYDEDEGAWIIRTRHLTSYAISDKKLRTVDQMDDISSNSNKPGKPENGGKYNPDTGR